MIQKKTVALLLVGLAMPLMASQPSSTPRQFPTRLKVTSLPQAGHTLAWIFAT